MALAVSGQLARISVRGIVQGVGFRPFVYQLAEEYGLRGWVLNTSGEVRIEVEGGREALDGFITDLVKRAPPMARIEGVDASFHVAVGHRGFEIRSSVRETGKYQLVSPDLATCDLCRAETLDHQDRRYQYPFTNCTNCGPRFTIIEDIPYDRAMTTMRHFRMCAQCQAEYDNPLHRRFHAQPNACPVCGPRVCLRDSSGVAVPGADPLGTAARLLREGNVVAVKGLGGFLLACDATSEAAVRRLRERKRRLAKPLAIMVTGLDMAQGLCWVTPEEEALLLSARCPIVLLRRKPETDIAEAVAPGLRRLGVMLPYTPLHHVLTREAGLPLVMTSGNLSEEPIARDNDEAMRRLSHVADFFLLHDRGIHSRYDDSVVTYLAGAPRLLRRARGYAPDPVPLAFPTPQVLACGAELKNTFCLTRDKYAFVSQHIGDMENAETLEHFEATVELYQRLFRIKPEIVACDLHPDYLATRYAQKLAEENGLPLIPVQHHHAHIAACLAENRFSGTAIGVAFDGTGYGPDGTVWGGEFLVADCRNFSRAAHLEQAPMPGGDAAVRRPYRMALGYLLSLLGEAGWERAALLSEVERSELAVVKLQVANGWNSPLTSSCGRLFDAVSAILGIRYRAEYEAQAAIELESAAEDAMCSESGQFYAFDVERRSGARVVRLAKLLQGVLADLRCGTPVAAISARFHHTMAELIVRTCREISHDTGLKTVALSGGVFQNRLLFERSIAALERSGFSVLTHHLAPCNDGGLSLGQAVVAALAGRSN